MDDDAQESVAPLVRRLRQRALSDRLRESLLFLPLVLLVGGIGLEQGARVVDRHVGFGWLGWLQMDPGAAETLLSTIAGATITTAGVVFSLLVVSLQLASGQFSPRVLRTFWRDRVGQVLIGLLLATFAFCVLALSELDSSADHAPTVTMILAIMLALASILAIVGYLNRITRQQYVGRIMERIQEEALVLVGDLPYGLRMGEACGRPVTVPDLEAMSARSGTVVIEAPTDGWVQQISRRAMLEALPDGSVVRLETRVGAYLVRGQPLAQVWPKPAPGQQAEVARLIAEAAIIGVTRTMQQDIDFALRQLNDIGLRALSPAVNDPTTAIEVILRVTSVLRPLLVADLPHQVEQDEAGRVLLIPWELDHAEYVRHAYSQIRLYGAPHPQVGLTLIRAMRMLTDVARAAGRSDAVTVLGQEIDAVLDGAAGAGLSEHDLAPLRAVAGAS